MKKIIYSRFPGETAADEADAISLVARRMWAWKRAGPHGIRPLPCVRRPPLAHGNRGRCGAARSVRVNPYGRPLALTDRPEGVASRAEPPVTKAAFSAR